VSARKERDRYRGRRRLPTPPRSRYAAVATTALLGAGIVGVATAAAMPDMKVTDPSSLAAMSGSTNIAASRQAIANQASRSQARGFTTEAAPTTSALDLWLLPMHNYKLEAPFGESSSLSQGVDLLAPEGTPFYASHSGTVTLARWNGGYGYTVIVNVGKNVELVYGHASKLLVHEGQKVSSGDLLALTGNTGYSFEPCVRFEVRIDGATTDPIAYLSEHLVDLTKHTDSLS
jgi:murein DD-endopeptidase MepM/ murein hydrolase activator NlpD